MKRSFIRAVAAVLVGAGGALAQTPTPGPSAAARPQVRAATPARDVTPAPLNGTGTLVSASPASPYSPSGPPWMASPAPSCPDQAVLPSGCLDPCAAPSYTCWGNAEYLLWRIERGSIPDLTARPPVGVLTVRIVERERTRNADGSVTDFRDVNPNNPLTGFFPIQMQVIPTIPEGPVELGNHSGVRLGGGMWFTPDHLCGVEASGYYLGRRSSRFNNTATNANGQFILTTPFSDQDFEIVPSTSTPPGPPTRTLLATRSIFFVRQANSELNGNYANDSWGAEVNARSTFFNFATVAVGGLVGFRYIDLQEEFDLDGRFSLFPPPGVPLGSGDLLPGNPPTPRPGRVFQLDIRTRDRIFTRNHFYGGQVGLDFNGTCGKFFVNLRPRIAIGGVHQVVQIEGTSTTFQDGTVTSASPGGLLFAPLDVGRIKRDRFAVIPEVNLKAGFEVTHWLRAYVGYDLMGFFNMVRPGDVSATSSMNTQITSPSTTGSGAPTSTTVVNVIQPTFRFRDSDILIQGINFGIELRY